MQPRRLGLGAQITAVVALVVSVMTVAPTTASADCTSAYGSKFDGYTSKRPDANGSTYEGAKAQIQIQKSAICGTPNGVTQTDNWYYLWAMLVEDNAAGSGRGYIQMGYMRWDNGCTHWTSEYHEGPNSSRFIRTVDYADGCRPISGSDLFSVRYILNGSEQMVVEHNGNTNVIDSTPWDIFVQWISPFWTEFNGETKYTQTDMPGTEGDLAIFKEMRVQKFDNTWTANLPNYLDTCPWPLRYNKSALATNTFGVDTNPNDNRTGFIC